MGKQISRSPKVDSRMWAMKKDKKKFRFGIMVMVVAIGSSFFSIVHAQKVSTAPDSKPISSITVGSPKNVPANSVNSKISQGLMDRYKDYRARQHQGSGGEESTLSAFVTIDAIAAEDASILKRDMEALGLKNSGWFGRVVSGNFPLAEIPKLSDLESLKFARLAVAHTHN